MLLSKAGLKHLGMNGTHRKDRRGWDLGLHPNIPVQAMPASSSGLLPHSTSRWACKLAQVEMSESNHVASRSQDSARRDKHLGGRAPERARGPRCQAPWKGVGRSRPDSQFSTLTRAGLSAVFLRIFLLTRQTFG